MRIFSIWFLYLIYLFNSTEIHPIDESSNYAQTETVSSGNRYAFIVGISKYSNLPPLAYADDDALEFYSLCRSAILGDIPHKNIIIILDSMATRGYVNKQLSEITNKLTVKDTLFFYFSGHASDEELMLFNESKDYQSLAYQSVNHLLSNSKVGMTVSIIDACYSGGLLTEMSALTPKNAVSVKNVAYVSSRIYEMSSESKALQSGIFSKFFFHELRKLKIQNPNGRIDISLAFKNARTDVMVFTSGSQVPDSIAPDSLLF